ncbi:MAG TPA: hypothetical protein VGX25_10190 [Actinophytocola sp.]|uniref:hypothetical protein n=1 Tax=Actinophytocola sp. TaxID=1872138 RepID=UPI002DDCD4C1|nr:hypothetical protein [Actinophytocola sp.]HEV2779757.1 hypothetical protein [Actinophytocola sp.]
MPENEQQSGPPALRPPGEPAPSSPSPPPQPIDPEQVRQFQQFQQFQELMRQQGGNELLLPPAPKRPLWQRILRGKLFRRLALLAIIVLTAPLWWPLLLTSIVSLAVLTFGASGDQQSSTGGGGGTYHTNHILKDSPYESVRQVYQRIADNSETFACGVFTDEAAQQFANNYNATDCPAAVAKLNAQVDKAPGSMNAYAEPDFRGKRGEPHGDMIAISSCELGVSAGPRLGEFTVSRVELGQWIITGHRLESC